MRVLLWSCRILIFLFLFAFAIKNTESVSVRFIFDSFWQAPLVIVLLAFFTGGALLGVLSLLGTVFGLRRELAKLKRVQQDESSKQPGSQPENSQVP
ncbi:MAG: lipopolysaccharide assembly protein LapA domain-containing protein [Betaproteobacteria bacterium]